MSDDVLVRPELIDLNEVSRQRVSEQIEAKGGYCESCGATGFDIGGALYLGFLFLNEDSDNYMVALTCRNPECRKPRTGIVLQRQEFLTSGTDDAVN
ncbi:hypothetical protein A5634_07955 [Mycobacterium asiaticum]|uniref:Uncharacterized protein n=1 Tax=Mycobacterium asiaticum TaxID=1790 RepID=A0A1A3NL73_MYCAS|nr:hypothetical protein [Mycobacterium asiaticum]OBK22100.1 hypothetical protein A5634_07955 [Mycobacterium asiaticum]